MQRAMAVVLGSALFLLGAGCGAEQAASGPLGAATQENHAWGCYHWARTANPFPLTIGDNVSSAWDAYLATAASDCNQSDVLNTTVVPGQSKGRCRPTAGRVEVCNNTYGNNGWLGVASISVNGCHITQGTVKLHAAYFNPPTYNTPAWRQPRGLHDPRH